MDNTKRHGLASFEVKEASQQQRKLTPFLNHRTAIEVYGQAYPEVIRVMGQEADKVTPFLLGDKADMMDFFRQKMVVGNSDAEEIIVEVELPEQENVIEVRGVNTAADSDGNLGARRSDVELVISTGNVTTKNIYALRDEPSIIIQPVKIPRLSSNLGYSVVFQIWGGHPDDHIPEEWLTTGRPELVNLGAPMEEAAVRRGVVEMSAGKAFVVYKYPWTRQGLEAFITDKHWQRSRHFTFKTYAEQKDGRAAKEYTITLLDLHAQFMRYSTMAFDRYLTSGKSPLPQALGQLDEVTQREIEAGPTVLDNVKANGTKEYNIFAPNLNLFLDHAQRILDLSEDPENTYIDLVTGNGAYNEWLADELARLDSADSLDGYQLQYAQGHKIDPNRNAVYVNAKQRTGIFLKSYGHVRVHISKMFNKGIFTGRKEWKGWKLSSYWVMMFIGRKDNDTNTSLHLLTNPLMEQRGFRVDGWTPTGARNNAVNTGRYEGTSGLGNAYSILNEMCKTVYMPKVSNIELYTPNIY
jgi:hypothetical protein